jgi:hypothetical protein
MLQEAILYEPTLKPRIFSRIFIHISQQKDYVSSLFKGHPQKSQITLLSYYIVQF